MSADYEYVQIGTRLGVQRDVGCIKLLACRLSCLLCTVCLREHRVVEKRGRWQKSSMNKVTKTKRIYLLIWTMTSEMRQKGKRWKRGSFCADVHVHLAETATQ